MIALEDYTKLQFEFKGETYNLVEFDQLNDYVIEDHFPVKASEKGLKSPLGLWEAIRKEHPSMTLIPEDDIGKYANEDKQICYYIAHRHVLDYHYESYYDEIRFMPVERVVMNAQARLEEAKNVLSMLESARKK